MRVVDAEVGMPHVGALDGALKGKRNAAETLCCQTILDTDRPRIAPAQVLFYRGEISFARAKLHAL